MLLAIDIGNTTITFGFFANETLKSAFTIPTVRDYSADQIHSQIKTQLDSDVSEIIVSSVVTELETTIKEFGKTYFSASPMFVNSSFEFGFAIKYFPPESCGIDRLIAAFAAVEKVGKPCIVCDFGTATTIDAVNSKNEYLGGVIVPGMKTLADSLFEKTSRLPKIEIAKPDTVIGNSTIGSIQSGIYHGYIGLVDGIIEKMIAEMNENPTVISTGGFSGLIAEGSKFVRLVDRNLILEGLRKLHAKQ